MTVIYRKEIRHYGSPNTLTAHTSAIEVTTLDRQPVSAGRITKMETMYDCVVVTRAGHERARVYYAPRIVAKLQAADEPDNDIIRMLAELEGIQS